ncbi:MAG: hypothetical protein M3Y49_19280 [Actinomycetota bacterium]|nr:hypothetical protein [Actinomycetota bacterium]
MIRNISRKMKFIGGGVVVAASAAGVAVPAYAASSAPSAPSTAAPSTSAPKAAIGHHPKARRELRTLGLTPAVIAKAAGTDVAGLKSGRAAKKSLTQIAASHGVSRATLLSRLDTTADSRVATLINTKLTIRPPAGRDKKCNAMPPKAGTRKHDGGRHAKGHGKNLRAIPGIGGDVKSLAGTLKITPNVLRADLRKGQTLQQIATANKVSTSTLLAALDKDVNTQLAKVVDRVPGAKPAAKTPAVTS